MKSKATHTNTENGDLGRQTDSEGVWMDDEHLMEGRSDSRSNRRKDFGYVRIPTVGISGAPNRRNVFNTIPVIFLLSLIYIGSVSCVVVTLTFKLFKQRQNQYSTI